MTVMAILQEVDKCVRCNGCVSACKREWDLKLPTSMSDVIPQKSIVGARQRLAIKSLRSGDMGPFMRFSCWHCPDPPCAAACPRGAIQKADTGAVYVDNTKCDPELCKTGYPSTPRPCEAACQHGGYPKSGEAYENSYVGLPKMNKCTACYGRAGVEDPTKTNMLPTRATSAEITACPERAHEPACVSTCPAKAMRWDTKANILAYLRDTNNGYIINGSENFYGNGSVYWASKKVMIPPPKADPFIEDHIAPMTSSLLSSGRMIVPTLMLGGLAALSARKAKVAVEEDVTVMEEV